MHVVHLLVKSHSEKGKLILVSSTTFCKSLGHFDVPDGAGAGAEAVAASLAASRTPFLSSRSLLSLKSLLSEAVSHSSLA